MSKKNLKKMTKEQQEKARLNRHLKKISPERRKQQIRTRMGKVLLQEVKRDARSNGKRLTPAGYKMVIEKINKDLDEAGY